MPGTDQRRAPRLRKRLRVFLSAGMEHPATTTNLSRTGFSVIGDHVLLPGTEVQGRLVLPTASVQFRAEVVWARKASGRALGEHSSMGLRFVGSPGPAYEGFLELEIPEAARSYTVAPSAIQRGGAAERPPIVIAPAGTAPRGSAPSSAPVPARVTPGPATGRARPAITSPVPGQPPAPEGLVTFGAARAAAVAPAAPAAGDAAGLTGRELLAEVERLHDARIDATIVPDDLALPRTQAPSPLSLGRASALIQEALIVAATARQPDHAISISLELDVAVDPSPVQVGQRVVVTADLTEAPGDRQVFSMAVRDGARTLAWGRFVRRLLPRR